MKKQTKEPIHDPVNVAIEAIRDTLHDECKGLPPDQYKEVLEEIAADLKGSLEALEMEGEE